MGRLSGPIVQIQHKTRNVRNCSACTESQGEIQVKQGGVAMKQEAALLLAILCSPVGGEPFRTLN